jgi:hypothetical protein
VCALRGAPAGHRSGSGNCPPIPLVSGYFLRRGGGKAGRTSAGSLKTVESNAAAGTNSRTTTQKISSGSAAEMTGCETSGSDVQRPSPSTVAGGTYASVAARLVDGRDGRGCETVAFFSSPSPEAEESSPRFKKRRRRSEEALLSPIARRRARKKPP